MGGAPEFYVIYAFVLLLLGTVGLMAPRMAELPMALRHGRLLAGFGFLHGAAELLEGRYHVYGGHAATPYLGIAGDLSWIVALLFVSYLPLAEIGRRLLPPLTGCYVGPWGYVTVLALVALLAAISDDPLTGINAALRVLLAMPALLLIAVSLLADAWRGTAVDAVVQRALWLAGASLLLYAPLEGLILEHSGRWALGLPDHTAFLNFTGISVQVPRALLMLLAVASLALVLHRCSAQVYARSDVAERKQAEAKLAEGELLLRGVVDATPDWIFVKDHEHRFVLVNRAFAAAQNVSPEQMIGQTDADYWPEEFWAGNPNDGRLGFHADDDEALAGTAVHNPYDPATLADGSRRVFDTLKLPLRDREGTVFGVLGYARDITERHETEQRLAATVTELEVAHQRETGAADKARRAQGRMSALLAAMSTGILFEDQEGRVEYVNPSFRKIWAIREDAVLESQWTREVLPHSSSEVSRQDLTSCHVLQVHDTHEGSERFELSLSDGRMLTQLSYPVEDSQGRGLGRLWCFEDITQERQTAQQLIYLAERDPLTGLYNRHRFQERLEELLKSAHRSVLRFALLYFDLDGFKQINDTFGHRAGDTVLVRTAGEVSTCLRSGELFARLGGDEFSVLTPIREPGDVAALATRIVTVVAAVPYRFRGTSIRVTASVGVALYPEHGASSEDLIVHADTAMYQAKGQGRNTWAMYSADERTGNGLNQRKIWSQRIAEALENERLELHFQGVFASRTRKLQHLEALVRMRDPQAPERLVMPGQFVPFAERTGQIVELDRWVLRQVIETLAQRPHMPAVAVNISGRSFDDPSLPQYVQGLLKANEVASERLLVELTETSAVTDIQDAQRFIEAIQNLGCRVCLDDFGSGFSSFAYLKYIEADVLKIDGLFIRDLARNHANQVFVRAMVDVAKGLRKQTIAEFVEDAESFEMVRMLGVDMAQGYYLDHPQQDHPSLRPPVEQ